MCFQGPPQGLQDALEANEISYSSVISAGPPWQDALECLMKCQVSGT